MTIKDGTKLQTFTTQATMRCSDVTIRFSAMSIKTRKRSKSVTKKRYGTTNIHSMWKADPGDHSGLLCSPPWDYRPESSHFKYRARAVKTVNLLLSKTYLVSP